MTGRSQREKLLRGISLTRKQDVGLLVNCITPRPPLFLHQLSNGVTLEKRGLSCRFIARFIALVLPVFTITLYTYPWAASDMDPVLLLNIACTDLTAASHGTPRCTNSVTAVSFHTEHLKHMSRRRWTTRWVYDLQKSFVTTVYILC